MALDLLYKLQTSSTTKLLLFVRKYQYINIQSLTYQITLKSLSTNFNCLLQYIRKSTWRRYKLSLQTNNSIEEITTITVVAVVPLCITATERDYVALYIIRKDVAYKNILKRSKKSLRLSLKISLRTLLGVNKAIYYRLQRQ